MKLINSLNNNPRQKFSVYTEDGNTLNVELYYYITQKSWYFDFEYGDYTCKGSRVVLTPNAIRHLKNILPFGIAFLSESNTEPFSVDDFSNGRIKMYILNKDEVLQIESEVYGV